MPDEKAVWWLWRDVGRAAAENMGVDEALHENSGALGGVPLLRCYGWSRPSVSIGYVQTFSAAPADGYDVVRRPTGGGVVFHDVDITYTVVVPSGHWIEKLDRVESYHVFHRAVLRALARLGVGAKLADAVMEPVDRATMRCFASPTRYDVLNESGKLAGAAQRRSRGGILHQGSISLKAAAGDRLKLQETLVWAFEQEFNISFSDFTPSPETLERADHLAKSKYSTAEWNKSR